MLPHAERSVQGHRYVERILPKDRRNHERNRLEARTNVNVLSRFAKNIMINYAMYLQCEDYREARALRLSIRRSKP